MPQIDRWVIRHYFRWLQQHPQHLQQLSLCSINLSGASLVVISDENLLGGLAPIAAKHRLYPHAVRMVSAVKRAVGLLKYLP